LRAQQIGRRRETDRHGNDQAGAGRQIQREEGSAVRIKQEDDRAHAGQDQDGARQAGRCGSTAKRTGGTTPKTRAELYEMAKRRDLPGRSKMGRDELAKKLGVR
jgi:hypothetical protein